MRDVIQKIRTTIKELKAAYNETFEQLDYHEKQVSITKDKLDFILTQIKENEKAIERLKNG